MKAIIFLQKPLKGSISVIINLSREYIYMVFIYFAIFRICHHA